MGFSGTGKSRAETSAENQQADEQAFYNELTQEMQSRYGQQSALLDQMQKLFQPIVDQGPNQYGFGPGEDSALRTQATEGTATAYRQAAQALGATMAAKDETGLPSGAGAQLQEELASRAAQSNAADQLGITNEGFNFGNQQYQRALQGLSGLAGALNPLGYAGAATSAGAGATGTIGLLGNLENQHDQQIDSAVKTGLSLLFGGGGGGAPDLGGGNSVPNI